MHCVSYRSQRVMLERFFSLCAFQATEHEEKQQTPFHVRLLSATTSQLIVTGTTTDIYLLLYRLKTGIYLDVDWSIVNRKSFWHKLRTFFDKILRTGNGIQCLSWCEQLQSIYRWLIQLNKPLSCSQMKTKTKCRYNWLKICFLFQNWLVVLLTADVPWI